MTETRGSEPQPAKSSFSIRSHSVRYFLVPLQALLAIVFGNVCGSYLWKGEALLWFLWLFGLQFAVASLLVLAAFRGSPAVLASSFIFSLLLFLLFASLSSTLEGYYGIGDGLSGLLGSF